VFISGGRLKRRHRIFLGRIRERDEIGVMFDSGKARIGEMEDGLEMYNGNEVRVKGRGWERSRRW
jgi:hypothetical protein